MSTVKLFTDGACCGNPGPGGWAVVCNIGNRCRVLSGSNPYTTNNRMELLAVIKALEKINNSHKHNVRYEIHSDSNYVVNTIQLKWIYNWRMKQWKTTKGEPVKNADLWERCYNLLTSIRNKQKEVQFVKVKGHAGNPLNEYADKVAREQARKVSRS